MSGARLLGAIESVLQQRRQKEALAQQARQADQSAGIAREQMGMQGFGHAIDAGLHRDSLVSARQNLMDQLRTRGETESERNWTRLQGDINRISLRDDMWDKRLAAQAEQNALNREARATRLVQGLAAAQKKVDTQQTGASGRGRERDAAAMARLDTQQRGASGRGRERDAAAMARLDTQQRDISGRGRERDAAAMARALLRAQTQKELSQAMSKGLDRSVALARVAAMLLTSNNTWTDKDEIAKEFGIFLKDFAEQAVSNPSSDDATSQTVWSTEQQPALPPVGTIKKGARTINVYEVSPDVFVDADGRPVPNRK